MKKAIIATLVVSGVVGGWFFFRPSPKVVGLSPHVDFTEVEVAEGKASMGTLSALEKEMARHNSDGLKNRHVPEVAPAREYRGLPSERGSTTDLFVLKPKK